MMGTQEIVDLALRLKADERYKVAELILNSLDRSDPVIDRSWTDEAQRRLHAYDAGRMNVTPIEEVLGDI
ncbi:MAG: addiction module protein [Sulfuricellaceae bacterium]